MTTTGPDPKPPDDAGKYGWWLSAVKGLTITNAIVIMMLVVVSIPSYVIWRALNDEKIMDRLMSSYSELHTNTSCIVHEAQLRGGPATFGITNGFAFQGRDRWAVSVFLDHQPDADEQKTYCETLNVFVDFLRDPSARAPTFPNTDTPLLQNYAIQNDQPSGGPR